MTNNNETKAMNGYNLFDYWSVLYRRRKTVYLIVSIAVIFSVILSFVMPKIYEAEAVFFVPSKPDHLTFFSGEGLRQITRSPLIPESKGERQKIYIGILKSETLRKKVQKDFPQFSLRQLKRNIDLRAGNDFLLKVYVSNRDPELAAIIANKCITIFNEMLNSYSLKTIVDNTETMKKLLVDTERKFDNARDALALFQSENIIVTMADKIQHLSSFRNNLENSLENARLKAQEIDKKLESLQKQFGKESDNYIQSSIAATSPLLETLKKQISDLESQIAGAKVELKDSHPQMVILLKQYGQKKKGLTEEIARVINSGTKPPSTFLEKLRRDLIHLLVERETLQARIDGLERGVANFEKQITALPEIQSRYQKLILEVDRFQKLIENLRVAIEEAEAQEQRSLMNVVVVDEATPPVKPIFPNFPMNIVVALGLGLVGGIFYAYFMEYLYCLKFSIDDDIRELEKSLKL
jgi:uncharacterized protein involved in exopolysaccharide biosynthesis